MRKDVEMLPPSPSPPPMAPPMPPPPPPRKSPGPRPKYPSLRLSAGALVNGVKVLIALLSGRD